MKHERDQPECCDDCPLAEACANKGPCGAFEQFYGVDAIKWSIESDSKRKQK